MQTQPLDPRARAHVSAASAWTQAVSEIPARAPSYSSPSFGPTGFSRELAYLSAQETRYTCDVQVLEDPTLHALSLASWRYNPFEVPPAWRVASDQVRRLAALAPGWDGEDAPPPSVKSQRRLLRLIRFVADNETVYPKIVTDFEGGLAAEWRAGRQSAAIEVDIDGDAYLYATDADGNRVLADRVELRQSSYPKISQFAAILDSLTRRVSRINPSWRSLFE